VLAILESKTSTEILLLDNLFSPAQKFRQVFTDFLSILARNVFIKLKTNLFFNRF